MYFQGFKPYLLRSYTSEKSFLVKEHPPISGYFCILCFLEIRKLENPSLTVFFQAMSSIFLYHTIANVVLSY